MKFVFYQDYAYFLIKTRVTTWYIPTPVDPLVCWCLANSTIMILSKLKPWLHLIILLSALE